MPTEISNTPPTSTATAEVVTQVSRKQRQPILPESIKRPLVLIWVGIVPQLVLLLLNLRGYQLVAGEMTPWQSGMARAIGAAELGLLLGMAALAIGFRVARRNISWVAAWALLVAPILYLWLFLYQIDAVLPRSVTGWILPTEQVGYDQFALLMPVLFYAAIRLACADIKISLRLEWAISIALVIGIPVSLFAISRLPFVWRVFDRHVPALVGIGFFVLFTLAVFTALLRLLVIGYAAVRRRGAVALGILSFFVGIAGPIGGLLLNRKIPFPADFQTQSIYALALINGAVLLMPNFRNPLLHRMVWLGQCVLFPFTFYFFVVFLPFLPLSLLAIVAAGAGFLVLTPTALFLVHGQRIYDGYRNEIRDGSRLKPALLGLIALSIIPAFYTIETTIDRVILRTAIDYVYAPNYRTSTHFEGSPRFVQRSLEYLRDSKAGLQLPFLSRFYNWVVFDGLVLPDDKMDHIHRALIGTNVAPVKHKGSGFFGPARPTVRPAVSTPPNLDVVLKRTSSAVRMDGDCHRATVTIEMKNLASSVAEFATTIDIPDGVLVSGFWLHIGAERVPGRVFEKKTALWVYQMIRDRTRRDPGILLFTNPNKLELRVYPFEPNEARQVEIEFLYPAPLNPTIAVGREILHPSGESASHGTVLAEAANGAKLWIAPDKLAELPKAPRTPYLHFIVDRSAGSDTNSASLQRAIEAGRAQFPDAKECFVTATNFEVKDLTREPQPIESAASLDLLSLPRRGGFMAGRAIKRALLRYHDSLADDSPENPWLTRFPVFIVVQSDPAREVAEQDLACFAKFAPDLPGYFVSSPGNALEFHGLRDTDVTPAVHPVALLKLGKQIAPCRAVGDKAEVVEFATNEAGAELKVFDAAVNSFVRLDPSVKIPSGTQYTAGVAVWQDYLNSIYNPSVGAIGLGKIVKGSRDSGILVGATSYIVVENSAQWKMLERKQKQKLGNNIELEFEAVPEPSTWCLIIFGGAFLVFLVMRRRQFHA